MSHVTLPLWPRRLVLILSLGLKNRVIAIGIARYGVSSTRSARGNKTAMKRTSQNL
jgi:hypothetical protein